MPRWAFQAKLSVVKHLSATTMSLTHTKKNPLVISLGIVLAILGAAGTLVISTMLAFLLPAVFDGGLGFLSHQALFQVMWAVVFLSLFVTGVSLISSGSQGRRHDLVPGLTLYFLGAALLVNGLLLLSSGHLVYAILACVIGTAVVMLEWQTEVI